jgi:hypothetical protein
MSRRMHFGATHHPYFVAYLFCLGQIETRYDWDSVSHYRFTHDIRQVTCKVSISQHSLDL